MIDHLTIKNFRSLRDVSVELKPLTILVGPNDSGKSSFLNALQRLSSATISSPNDFWRRNADENIVITARTPQGNVEFDSGIDGQWRRSPVNPSLSPGLFSIPVPNQMVAAKSCITPHLFIQLPTQGIQAISDGYPDSSGPQPLGSDGKGLPSLLDYMLRKERKRFDSITSTMRKLIEGLEDIEIATPTTNTRRIDFKIENDFLITADHASVGVRLLLFFVTMAYHPTPPVLILLEEPETGVHPKRLKEIVEFLRALAHGKHGRHAAQVIMTTHSPYLLDAVNLETDQVLVFRRKKDGSRTAEAVDAERLQTFLDEFLLGEVWFNQGEEGLVSRRQ